MNFLIGSRAYLTKYKWRVEIIEENNGFFKGKVTIPDTKITIEVIYDDKGNAIRPKSDKYNLMEAINSEDIKIIWHEGL